MKLKKVLLIPLIALSSLTACQKAGNGTTTSTGGGGQTSSPVESTPQPGRVCVENSGTLLSTVGASTAGTRFDGTVRVSGIKGTDLYVEDSSGAGFVYTKGTLNASIKVGDSINLSGTVALYSGAGIYQITEPTITVSETGCKLKEPAKTTLSQIDNYRMGRVTVENLEVTDISKFATGAVDSFITVKDSTGTYDIYISKRLDANDKAEIDNILQTLTVGTKIGIVGAFADYYKKPQISLTKASQISYSMTTDQKLALVESKLQSEFNNVSVRKDLSLPSTGDYGAKITWTSSNTKVITNSGVVTRPTDKDASVKLTCVITIDGKKLTKEYTVTVLKYVEGESDYEYTYVEPNYTGNYYTSIDELDRGNSLLTNLNKFLAKTPMPSKFSYSAMWDIFPDTDGVPGQSGKYYAFYTGKVTDRNAMNKEHVWPKSRGSGNGGSCEKDPHMVRPALTADNSGRGNDFYNQSPTSYDPGKLGNNDYRGIAARIIFYCAVKYQHEGLKLVDLTSDSTSNKSMGKLSTLLEWNLKYDIDPTEVQRNEALYSKYKWVRNPFIDDRNYACKIWGDTNASTRQVCGKR